MESQRLFKFYSIRQISFVFLLICIIYSCSSNTSKPTEEVYEETEEVFEETEEVFEEAEEIKDSDGDGVPDYFDESDSHESIMNPEDYIVTLDVTRNFKLHKKGDLRVWIGIENFVPSEREDMARDITRIPSNIGLYAKVTPYAPDFDVQPENSQCIRIDPSGSSVLFSITPLRKGEFRVSSKVEIFKDSDCSGTPIPKSSEILTVTVTVDKMEVFKIRLGELFTIFWDKFLSLWGAVITIIFGLILYLLRKFLMKKTGYNDKE